MIDIREIFVPDEKSKICGDILRALPDWFGIEASIIEYMENSRHMTFYAAFDGDKAIGFIAKKVHNIYTAEVYVMGIVEEYHRKGIGRELIKRCEQYCAENKIEFLTVKTLDSFAESESYNKTRQFYSGLGFKPLEVFPLLWDENNPCLFMAKVITQVGL